jgi:hypothetical protein
MEPVSLKLCALSSFTSSSWYANEIHMQKKFEEPILFGTNMESEYRALFRCTQKLEFFHSLSITSIFSRLHEVLNVG